MADGKSKIVSIISFTREGGKLAQKIILELQKRGYVCTGYRKTAGAKIGQDADKVLSFPKLLPVYSSLTQWAGEQFLLVESLIFVGATGIAVRAVAPWIRDKFQDPAVLVVDEMGKFVIPLLSGHIGGGNDFAQIVAAFLSAVPVITTATDLRGCFAVDVFARERGLWISDRKLAKVMSAEALEGNPIGVFSDISVRKDELPGCCLEKVGRINLYLGIWKREKWDKRIPLNNTLQLVPSILTLGIGCRRGIASEELKVQIMEGLEGWGIWPRAVKRMATVTLKREEKAIHELCREMNWELCFFSPEELNAADGDFSYSAFVEQVVGVGNVCERAAVLGAGIVSGTEIDLGTEDRLKAGVGLMFRKKIHRGVTMAMAGCSRR